MRPPRYPAQSQSAVERSQLVGRCPLSRTQLVLAALLLSVAGRGLAGTPPDPVEYLPRRNHQSVLPNGRAVHRRWPTPAAARYRCGRHDVVARRVLSAPHGAARAGSGDEAAPSPCGCDPDAWRGTAPSPHDPTATRPTPAANTGAL